jgi:hypothetical protein
MYFANPDEDYFRKCVKDYINELFDVIDNEGKYVYLYFDQLLPPTNINRYLNYFDNIHVIVVDRDPRDLYIDNVIIHGEPWVPPKMDDFVIWFKKTRQKVEKDNGNILRIKFEDMVYHYKETTRLICEFLNIYHTENNNSQKYFNPAISICNTQLWKTNRIDINILEYIQKNLNEYLYSFPNKT